MNCETAREEISALLDGEALRVPRGELDEHLAECSACRTWRESAHEVTRRTRLGPARSRDDVERLVARVAGPASRRRAGSLTVARIALLLTAAAQLLISVPVLILGEDHDAPLHVAHEMGSFDVALAVGFIVAALRPSRAVGMKTIVGAVALLLLATAALDVLAGRTTAGDEAPHLLALAGWLLLSHLARVAPTSGDMPALPLPRLRWRRRPAVGVSAAVRRRETVVRERGQEAREAQAA